MNKKLVLNICYSIGMVAGIIILAAGVGVHESSMTIEQSSQTTNYEYENYLTIQKIIEYNNQKDSNEDMEVNSCYLSVDGYNNYQKSLSDDQKKSQKESANQFNNKYPSYDTFYNEYKNYGYTDDEVKNMRDIMSSIFSLNLDYGADNTKAMVEKTDSEIKTDNTIMYVLVPIVLLFL